MTYQITSDFVTPGIMETAVVRGMYEDSNKVGKEIQGVSSTVDFRFACKDPF
jgi:hypothetical protein